MVRWPRGGGRRGVEPAVGGEDGLGEGDAVGARSDAGCHRRRFGRRSASRWISGTGGDRGLGLGRLAWLSQRDQADRRGAIGLDAGDCLEGQGRARCRARARRRGAELTCQTSEPPSMMSSARLIAAMPQRVPVEPGADHWQGDSVQGWSAVPKSRTCSARADPSSVTSRRCPISQESPVLRVICRATQRRIHGRSGIQNGCWAGPGGPSRSTAICCGVGSFGCAGAAQWFRRNRRAASSRIRCSSWLRLPRPWLWSIRVSG